MNPKSYRTRENETVEGICYRLFGETQEFTEEVLALNPHLADYGAILPENLCIQLPLLSISPPIQKTIQLWD